jgi:hypothetical protein
LAERQRKKPRTAKEGETAIGTDQGVTSSEVTGSSPQREAHIQFPLASIVIESSAMETNKESGSG